MSGSEINFHIKVQNLPLGSDFKRHFSILILYIKNSCNKVYLYNLQFSLKNIVQYSVVKGKKAILCLWPD